MCLTVQEDAVEKVADKPIICFKTGRGRHGVLISIFNNFYYELNIVAGSTSIGYKADEERLAYSAKNELNIGYHSHNSLSSLWVGECGAPPSIHNLFLIPKGATYYDGMYNFSSRIKNRLSNQIIWLGSVYSPMSWIRAIKYFIN